MSTVPLIVDDLHELCTLEFALENRLEKLFNQKEKMGGSWSSEHEIEAARAMLAKVRSAIGVVMA